MAGYSVRYQKVQTYDRLCGFNDSRPCAGVSKAIKPGVLIAVASRELKLSTLLAIAKGT